MCLEVKPRARVTQDEPGSLVLLRPSISAGPLHLTPICARSTWAQGEEPMRTLKLKLLEMMPDLQVFLDKDDLKDGAGAEYVDVSRVVLCFCTVKYYLSRACAREISILLFSALV